MRSSLAVACVCAWLAGACGGSLPATHYYRLSHAEAAQDGQPIAGSLAIESFEADASLSDDRIVYRTSPNRVDYYDYHRWTSPPASLLADYLREAYVRSGWFARVLTHYDSDSDVSLSGRVTLFEEVDVSPTRWEAHIALELSAREPRSGATFWSERYSEIEPIAERTPEGLASALSRATQRIVAASARELAQVMRARAAQVEPLAPN